MDSEAFTKAGAVAPSSRRALLKGAAAAGVAVIAPTILARDHGSEHEHGDIAILRFLAAAELIEADLWQQYTELAFGNPQYNAALSAIDDAIPQYSQDTTADEVSHHTFINGYLRSIHAAPVNLEPFRTLPSVPATGANQAVNRLTNLRSLNLDTSWYLRYRGAGNPDFGDTFPQIAVIQHEAAVPVSDGLTDDQVKAAAYTAAFHFPQIEQGGTSLYSSLLRNVSGLDALEILAGIGPVEAIHFKIFEDTLEDLEGFTAPDGTVFPALGDNGPVAHAVMPKPCTFLSRNLPVCSVVRPSNKQIAGARAALAALTSMNIFDGQSNAFFSFMRTLANEADLARRDGH